MSPHRKLIAFRLDDQLLARLEQSALEDDRPVSYQVRKAIESWLEAREARGSGPRVARVSTPKRSSKR